MEQRVSGALVGPPVAALVVWGLAQVLHLLPIQHYGPVALVALVAAGAAGLAAWWWSGYRPVGTYAAAATLAAGWWLAWTVADHPLSGTSTVALLVILLVLWPAARLVSPYVPSMSAPEVAETDYPSPDARPGEDGDRTSDPWVEVFAAAGYPGVVIEQREPNRAGYTLLVRLPAKASGSARDLKSKQGSLAALADHMLDEDVRDGGVLVEANPDSASRARVTVVTRDVLAETRNVPVVVRPQSIRDGLRLGLHADGRPLDLLMHEDRVHLLVVGTTGAGKSNCVRTIMYRLMTCYNVSKPWVGGTAKLRGLVEGWLRPYASDPERGPLGCVAGQRQDHVLEMLAAAVAAIDYRQGQPRTGDELDPDTFPVIPVILGESNTVLRNRQKIQCHDGEMRTASKLWQLIGQLGRSELVWQLREDQFGTFPSAGDYGADIMKTTHHRICLRVESTGDGQAVLGSAWGARTVALSNHAFYYKHGPEALPVQAKADRLDAEDVPAMSKRVSGINAELDEGTARAIAQWWDKRWDAEHTAHLRAWLSGRDVAAVEAEDQQAAEEEPAQSVTQPNQPTGPRRRVKPPTPMKLGANGKMRPDGEALTRQSLARWNKIPVEQQTSAEVDATFAWLTSDLDPVDVTTSTEPGSATPAATTASEPPAVTPEPAPPAAPVRRRPQPLQSILDALAARPELVLTTASGAELVAAKDLVVAIGRAPAGDSTAISRASAELTRELGKRWSIGSTQQHIPGRGTVRGYEVTALRKAGEVR